MLSLRGCFDLSVDVLRGHKAHFIQGLLHDSETKHVLESLVQAYKSVCMRGSGRPPV